MSEWPQGSPAGSPELDASRGALVVLKGALRSYEWSPAGSLTACVDTPLAISSWQQYLAWCESLLS